MRGMWGLLNVLNFCRWPRSDFCYCIMWTGSFSFYRHDLFRNSHGTNSTCLPDPRELDRVTKLEKKTCYVFARRSKR
jgi:cellulose synthase/poly-beta-1,6-N-acetylglucosamine synthase-like glycosyltransferase